MKTDFYTKAILTIIAIALVGNFLKDVEFFVSKANAKSTNLADFKSQQEQQTTTEQPDITFYVYESDLLKLGFGVESYYGDNRYIRLSKDPKTEVIIDSQYDTPKYIITTKTGTFMLKR